MKRAVSHVNIISAGKIKCTHYDEIAASSSVSKKAIRFNVNQV